MLGFALHGERLVYIYIYGGSRYLCSLPLLLIEVHKTLNKYQNVEMQYRPEGRFLFFVYKTVFRSLLHIVFTRKVIKVSEGVIKVSGSHCKFSMILYSYSLLNYHNCHFSTGDEIKAAAALQPLSYIVVNIM